MPKALMFRDPRLFSPPERPAGPYRCALGLDLANNMGFALTYFRPGEPFVLGKSPLIMGQWGLSPEAYESGALRFVKLRQFLTQADPDFVAFEMVRNTPPGDFLKGNRVTIAAVAARIMSSAQLLGAYMGTVGAWCEQYNVPSVGVGIGALKKRATGKGNAGKEDVIRACNAEFGTDFSTEGYETSGVDNIADAAFCLMCGLEAYADGVELMDVKSALEPADAVIKEIE